MVENRDTSGIGDPHDSHEYQDFEIPYEAKLNIKEIERCLRNGLYDSETMVREHLDLLENLDSEVTMAIESEKRIGRYNATLKHDQDKVRKLMRDLEKKLGEFDAV
jgi:hypothetical protein